MKIERVIPKPPPAFALTFTHDEGVTLVAALNSYADTHPNAVHHKDWKQWARNLDEELRR